MLALESAAQPRAPLVGCLFISDAQRSAWWLAPWRKALAEAGFVEGRNLSVEYRWATGDLNRLPGFAADLVARRVSVIVATTEPGATAAMRATTTIPIVFNFISDPVGKKLVKSLARPGGNVTGVAIDDEGALESKRLQLLHEFVPSASRIGYLVGRQDAAPRRGAMNTVAAAGRALGVEVALLMVDSVEEIDPAFSAARQRGIGAVLVQTPSTFLYAEQRRVVDAALRHGLPAASGQNDFAEYGGVMRYSGIREEAPHLTGTYVAKILNGQNPAELPVHLSDKQRLVVNIKAAKMLGLRLPIALLARADEIIE